MKEFAAKFNRVETYLSGDDDKGHYVQPMIPEKMSEVSFASAEGVSQGKIYV